MLKITELLIHATLLDMAAKLLAAMIAITGLGLLDAWVRMSF